MLSRDQILASDDLPKELVPVPEWGGSVYVRTMTGTERDGVEAASIGNDWRRGFRARLAVATVCDEQGNALFTAADIEALGRKSSAALDRIFEVACRLNKLGAADVNELEKNSSAIHSGDSASALPASEG